MPRRRTSTHDEALLGARIIFLVNLPQDAYPALFLPGRRVPRAVRQKLNELMDTIFQMRMEPDEAWEYRQSLENYLRTWLDAGCSASDWQHRREFQAMLARREPLIHSPRSERARVLFNPILLESELFAGDTRLPKFSELCRIRAQEMFLEFIQSAVFDRIGRCKRCSKYYYNRSGHRNKAYCSGPCARAASARKAKAEKRAEEQAEKLTAVRAALTKYSQLNDSKRRRIKNLKGWVAEEARVTPHFITGAQRRGALANPLS